MKATLHTLRARLARAPELLRFGVVAVIGLVVDIALAYGANAGFGVPLIWAAALGFAAGACVNYALHELWTFRSGARRLSAGRALKYALSLGATLLVRLTAVAMLAVLLGETQPLMVLILATGLSFGMNYMMSKLLVFRPARTTPDKGDE